MGKAKPARKGRAPRAVGGGRSARYSARRNARGATTQYAAAWSDAAAKAVLDALHALKQQTSEELCKVCADVLASDGAIDAFVDRQCKQLDRAGRELARGIMRVNMAKIAAAKERKGAAAAKDRIYGFLKPLRVRKREAGTVEELVVDTVGVGSKSFHAWLSPEPARDRTRDMTRNKRIMAGISKWPLGWLERPGVVCYERAAGRVRGERNGRPDAAFMRGVVKTVELPTAVENPADYVLVEGPGQARFLDGGGSRAGLWRPGWEPITSDAEGCHGNDAGTGGGEPRERAACGGGTSDSGDAAEARSAHPGADIRVRVLGDRYVRGGRGGGDGRGLGVRDGE